MGKPFAKVDTALRDHPKAVAAGPYAMGVWLAALCYIRDHLTDGFVPREAVPGFFGGGDENLKAVAKLVAQGLFLEAPGGFQLANYAVKNQTKEQVNTAIEGARERMRRVRESRRSSDDVRANIERTNAFVPPSPSPSLSDLDQDPTRARDHGAELVPVVPGNAVNDDAATPPPWFLDACAAVDLVAGEKLTVGECWLRYHGHRAGTPGKRPGKADAQYWLTSVVVPELRRERERTKRLASLPASAPRGAPEPAPAPYHREWKPPKDQGTPIRGEEAARLGDGLQAALGGGAGRGRSA
jgi:hypothetical protein